MKKPLALSFLILSFILTQAQNYYSRQAGNWSDNVSVWSTTSQSGVACACNPGNSLGGSTSAYIYNTITASNALSSLSGSGKLTVESGDTLTINAASFSLSGSSAITVNGTLFLYAPLSMTGSSAITINSSGNVYIYGNISNSGSALVTDNGSLTIHGNVSTSGSASFTGTGKSYVIGTVTGPNTSFLSVLPDFFSSFSNITGNGLVTYQSSPLTFQPLQFNNNSSTVLTGNGTFTNISSLLGNNTLQSNYIVNDSIKTSDIVPTDSVIAFGDPFLTITNSPKTNSVIISDKYGNLSFANNNLTTTGNVKAGSVTTSSIGSATGTVNFGANNINTTGTFSTGTFNATNLSASTLTIGTINSNNGYVNFGTTKIHNNALISTSSLDASQTVSSSEMDAKQIFSPYISTKGNSGPVMFGTSIQTSENIACAVLGASTYAYTPAIVSPTGTVDFTSNNITTTGTLTTGTFNTTNLGANNISSTTGTVGFGANNISTTGATNIGSLSASGNITLTGIPVDTIADSTANNFVQVDRLGRVTSGSLTGTLTKAMEASFQQQNLKIQVNCTNSSGTGAGIYGFSCIPSGQYSPTIWYVLPCALTGIQTQIPDAAFTINANGNMGYNPNASNDNVAFSIANYGNGPSQPTTGDVFTIDQSGNTYAAGNVGIGISTPNAKLDVENGNMLIQTTYNQYALNVGGTIWANEVRVCLSGCDFVFSKEYSLMPLEELEQYLQLNHHLPGVASAKEMENSDGVALGKMNSQLLQKVEELTLYILQQQKDIQEQKEELNELKNKISTLEKK